MRFLFSNYHWVPIIVAFFVFSAFTSLKINEGSMKWFWINYAVGLIPFWALVARYSNSIIFDGIVFDMVMTTTYLIAICIFSGSLKSMSWVNITGLVVVVAGLLMIKKGN